MLSAIIVAAGNSRRAGFDKLFAPLLGKPTLSYSIAAFERVDRVTEIIVVVRPDRHGEIEKLRASENWKKVRQIVAGGEERHDSVRAGLTKLSDAAEYVAVHDAARPLITPPQIERVFEQCQIDGAAALAEPVADTLKRADVDFFVTEAVDRKHLFAMQTPQIFERDMLEQAYRALGEKDVAVTDEVSALEHLGYQVVLVPADDFNFKITYKRDLKLAELVLRQRAESS